MNPLMIGLAGAVALVTVGLVSWSIALYFHDKHVHPMLDGFFDILFLVCLGAAIIVLLGIAYVDEDCLTGASDCFSLSQ
jgi:hypothetical protein